MTSAVIPNRPAFRAQEVCEIAGIQPYVLRSWEAEFTDLGVAKTAGGPRVYRRGDVERVLRLKHLLFVDGLTLAGARKQLLQETRPPADPDDAITDADVAALMDQQARQVIRELRGGLESILGVLAGRAGDGEFALSAQPPAADVKSPGDSKKTAKAKKR